jgi:hypothetical protein
LVTEKTFVDRENKLSLKYFPKDYYNLEYVKTIIYEIEKRIKECDMKN